MQNIFIELLPPWVETGLQPAFYDKESGTVLQQVSRMYAKINQLIGSVNNQNKTITDYIQKFIDLKDYVETYFNNLDVQSEINNKLDQMSANGQLADIIAQYLKAQAVFGFDTIAEMSASENLANGAICKVLGKTNYQTGDGGFYKIRTITLDDVIDGVNIVAITHDNTLIAELITNYTFDKLEEYKSDLQGQINDLITPPKKYIFVGDSYGDGYNPDGNVEGWGSRLATMLGLSAGSYINTHQGGMGFSRSSEYNYYTLINALSGDTNVTDIVIAGSYNDLNGTETAIIEGINSVYTLCKSKFPKAKLHIAFIGWSSNGEAKRKLIDTYVYYKNACDANGDIDFIENIQYTLHQYHLDFASDGIHPTSYGQNKIARNLANYLLKGKCNISYKGGTYFTPVNSGSNSGSWTVSGILNNDTITMGWNRTGVILWTNDNAITLTGKAPTKIADITEGLVVGNDRDICKGTCLCVCQTTDDKYHKLYLDILIQNGSLYIVSNLINSAGTNFDNYIIKSIQFGPLNITVNSMIA